MVQRVITLLIDDLTGKSAHETVAFALDGTEYEIDLNKRNATKMRKVLADYVSAGRRTNGGRASHGSGASRAGNGGIEVPTAMIRTWAAEKGYAVSARGRLSVDIVNAYKNAHR